MILTVIIEDGKLQAAGDGDARWSEISKKRAQPGVFQAGVEAGPGQTIQIVEVPDKFRSMFADPTGFMSELDSLLKSRGLL